MATNNEDEVRLQKELQELVDNRLLTEKQALQLQKTINVEQEKTLDNLKDQLKTLNEQLETTKVLAKASGNYAEQIRKTDELEVKQKEIALKLAKDALATAEDRVAAEKALVEAAVAYQKAVDKSKDSERALQKGQQLGKLLGIDEANQNSLTYQMFKNPEKIFSGFKENYMSAGGLAKGFGISLLMKIQEATVIAFQQNDAAISSFVAATGASRAYNDVIVGTARGNTALGISFQQSGKAVTDLYTNLNTFTTLNKSAQAELTVTTAKLEKLGISGGDTAKSIRTLSVSMGQSEVQAAKTVEKFAAMGQAMGISSRQMIADFAAVGEQLSVFGATTDQVFLKLQAQSKATSVAVSDLLNLANKFDTFEGAATQVGKLNAILGGPFLSAMSMIEATDPTERIDLLRQAVNNANVSFESMSYYQKKAIMEAGGFKSVEEAQRILSMSAGEAAEELQRQQASQEELNNAIQRAQPIQEKLSLIMANFAIIMGPVVEALSEFLSLIATAMDNQYIVSMIKALAIFAGVLIAIGTGPILIIAAAIGAIGAALLDLHDVLLVPKSPILFDVLVALSGVFNSIGQAAINIGNSVGMVADSFMKLHDSAISGTFYLFEMAAGLYAIGEAINTIESDKALNMKVMMEKIVQVSEPTTLKGFEQFSEKFNLVAEATAKVDATKTQTFTNLLNATQNLSQALKLNQTVIVKIGDKKIQGVITEVLNDMMPDQNITNSTT